LRATASLVNVDIAGATAARVVSTSETERLTTPHISLDDLLNGGAQAVAYRMERLPSLYAYERP
jgi:hypothetical protein